MLTHGIVNRKSRGDLLPRLNPWVSQEVAPFFTELNVKKIARPTPFERRLSAFWSKVDRNGPVPPLHPDMSNCWIWAGCHDGYGYGTFCIGGSPGKPQNRSAHRTSFLIANGRWPEHEIDHTCHVRGCVRPGHFADVTHKVNTRNRARKICVRGHAQTEKNFYYYANGTKRRCRSCIEGK